MKLQGKTCKNTIQSRFRFLIIHPYRALIVRDSRSGKTNGLLNLINYQPDIDKIFVYVKDPYKLKYQYLIKKRDKVWPTIFQ